MRPFLNIRCHRPSHAAQVTRPRLEVLEDRTVPTLVGPALQLSDGTVPSFYSSAAGSRNGTSIAVWVENGFNETPPLGSSSHIRGQLFNAAGIKLGGVFLIAETPFATRPDVAMDAAGNFVVTWTAHPA